MKLTRHALLRAKQRGFQETDLFLIEHFGYPVRKDGNVTEFRMPRKILFELRRSLDRINRKAILVNENDQVIITAYNLNKGY